MERRSKGITILTSLIPGVGYMYLGLMNKGIEALIIFFLVPQLFKFMGFHFIAKILSIVVWFYTFFDTLDLAKRMDYGETVIDSTVFSWDMKNKSFSNSISNDGKNMKVLAWILIIFGLMVLCNRIFDTLPIGNYIRDITKDYMVPVLFIIGGVYMLFKTSKNDN